MTGVAVVALTLALAAIVVMASPGRRRRRGGGPSGAPAWLVEPPLPPGEADRRSLELLRSVVNREEWDMFCDLGFICVEGRSRARAAGDPPRYRYLVYPHLPLVALLPRSLAPVREYCVQFPDLGAAGATRPLPVGDDVLAKWMTLRADEDRLLAFANVGAAGCQVPLRRIEHDVRRLERWTRRRRAQNGAVGPSPGSGPPSGVDAGSPSAVSSSMRR
jgi:hypothetical protein